jgi:signal transduction histidine kinase
VWFIAACAAACGAVLLALVAAVEPSLAQPSRIDSLRQRVETARKQHNDTATVLALNDLAYSFWASNSAFGVGYAKEAVRLADSVGFPSGKALALCTLGWCYYNQSQFVQAMETYFQGQAIAESIGNKPILGRILEFKGILYRFLYKYPERALQEHLQALQLLKNSQDTTFLVELWEDIAIDYTLLKKPNEGLAYFAKTVPYFRAIADTVNLVVSYSYMGECYFLQGEYQRSLETHQYALLLAERGGFFRSMAFNKVRIGRVYNQFATPQQALPYALSALEFSQKAHADGVSIDAYRVLVQSYKMLGKFKEMAQYQELCMRLEDSLFQDRIRNSTLVQQVDFDVQKREAQIQLLTKDAERRTIIGVGLLLFSGMAVLLVALLYRNNRRTQEANSQLHHTNIELDTALHTLKETQSQLVQSERMNTAGMLTAGVMHEINNPNAAVVAALHDAKQTVVRLKDFFFSLLDETGRASKKAQHFATLSEDVQHTLEVAQVGAERVQKIVSNLQHFTKHQRYGRYQGSLAAELRPTVEIFRYQFPQVDVEIDVQGQDRIEADFSELNQVFLNLLVNAAQADARRVEIHGEQRGERGEWVRLRFVDDGSGISEKGMRKVFEPFYSTKAVGNSGLGLSISKQIVERHGGRVWCESELDKGIPGATFIVELPAQLGTIGTQEKLV